MNKWFLVLILLPGTAWSMPGNDKQTQAVYTDEGRSPIPFAVACTSYSWTVVVSSDAIRRSLLIEESPASTVNVCISTATAGTCLDTTPGPELVPAGSVTIYDTASWSCQCRTTASCAVKGVTDEDKGDFGLRSAASTQ